jgi:dTDP-4-dehydrorhamnose reductase
MYQKLFDDWNSIKKKTNNRHLDFNVRAGDIWWMTQGVNIGSEIDGKGKSFTRPCLVLKIVGGEMLLVVPLTSKSKKYDGYMPLKLGNRENMMCLNHIKTISKKRILGRISHISEKQLEEIKVKIANYYGFLKKTPLCSNVHITMHILILGSQGMLGQELERVAVARGFNVTAWDKKDIDVTEAGALGKIRELKPDVIINSIAYNAVDHIEDEGWGTAEKINGELPGQLAAVACELGATLVHFSSDYVFDGENDAGYAEDAEPQPVNAYGRSKMMGEDAVRMLGDKYYIVRLSRLFGKPAVSEGAKRSFVDIMINLGQTKDAIDLVDEEKDCVTYAPDLAEEVFNLLEEKVPYGIYHITNSGACTWHDFGSEIFKLIGSDIAVTPVPASAFPRPAARPRTSELLNTKRPAMRSWQAALEEYIRSI